jgi:hypothetical protein
MEPLFKMLKEMKADRKAVKEERKAEKEEM